MSKRREKIKSGDIKEKIEKFLYSDSPEATATKIILGILGGGAIVCTGAVAPGILKAIEFFRNSSNSFTTNKDKKYSW